MAMRRSGMVDARVDELASSLESVLASPTPDGLWALQKALLALEGPDAARAREVARSFHACLRTLESKSASRAASRWGAVLGTAAVGSVSVSELRDRQEHGLEQLIEGALPAVLEIGASLASAGAWEIEARLVFDEFAWFLYQELWDISAATRPRMAADERTARIDELLDPLLDPGLSDADRATLMVDVYRSVLAARFATLARVSGTD
jgi:hypothetical protein